MTIMFLVDVNGCPSVLGGLNIRAFSRGEKTVRDVLNARFNCMIFKMANLQHTPSPAFIIADYFSAN